MPTVAIVEGVRIVFYANEHPPAHFHAKIGEHQAVISIEQLAVLEGFLPLAKRRIVLRWAAERQSALRRAFSQATALELVNPIE